MIFWLVYGMTIFVSFIVCLAGYRLLQGKYVTYLGPYAASVIFMMYVNFTTPGGLSQAINDPIAPQLLIAGVTLMLPLIFLKDTESQKYFEEFQKEAKRRGNEDFKREKKLADPMIAVGALMLIGSIVQFFLPIVPKMYDKIAVFGMFAPIGAFLVFVGLFYYKKLGKKLKL
jgi:hypothetical protein